MNPRHAEELFYDSEATLRLVDSALADLRLQLQGAPDVDTKDELMIAQVEPPATPLAELPNVLLRAYSEINNVLEALRKSRDVLEQTTVEKIQHTHHKLQEVTSATEVAATDMLDGLDRALAMVDELEAEQQSQEPSGVHDNLRNELFGLMNTLQFQDITTQQLNYASSVLVEMEHRLAEVARLFDPHALGISLVTPQLQPSTTVAFDPAATTSDAEHRQALVDEIFRRD